jgi:hypothetical protein
MIINGPYNKVSKDLNSGDKVSIKKVSEKEKDK